MKKKYVLTIIAIVLLLLAVGRLLFLKFKSLALDTTSQKLIEEVVKQGSGGNISKEQINEITNSIQENDKEKVENIIENHLDGDTIQKAMEYMRNKDIDGLKKFASEELTEEEKKELIDIYLQYKEQIDNVINNEQESINEDKNVDNSQDVELSEEKDEENGEDILLENGNEDNKEEEKNEINGNNNQYKNALDILGNMSQEEIQNLIEKYNNMSDLEKETIAKQYGVLKQEIDALVALYS